MTTTPHTGEPERELTEAERLKAMDLLYSMTRRKNEMLKLMHEPAADLRAFEERLIEHGNLADELWVVIRLAWEEDS